MSSQNIEKLNRSLENNALGQFKLGRYTDAGGDECIYDISKSSNFNLGLMGMSGVGKTYTISKVISAYSELITDVGEPTIFILDVQGDFDSLAGVPDEKINHVNFAYAHGDGAVNPLHVDPIGGIFVAVRSFVEIVKIFNNSLGARQAADLELIVNSLYKKFGFNKDDASTWNNEPPMLADLVEQVRTLIGSVKSGLEVDHLDAIKDILNKETLDECDIETEDGLKKYAAFGESVKKAIDQPRELGTHAKWNLERLESIEHTLVHMMSSGLFSGNNIKPEVGKINVYKLVKLQERDMLTVIHLLLDRIFSFAQRRAVTLNPTLPRMLVVLDEGKLAKESSKKALSPLNRIATEARKYGLGAILGVQSPDHISDDLRRNCAGFIIMPVHPSEYSGVKSRFHVDIQNIINLTPRSEGLVYLNDGRFRPVRLFAE